MKNLLEKSVETEMLRRIDEVTLASARQWGKMTAPQMICHCTDQIRSAIGEKPAKSIGNFFHKTILKRLVLYVIKSPKGKVETASEFHQEKGGTRPTVFEKDKIALKASIQRFLDASIFYPHPMFGDMSKKEWGRMIYLHLDHHLEQFNH